MKMNKLKLVEYLILYNETKCKLTTSEYIVNLITLIVKGEFD